MNRYKSLTNVSWMLTGLAGLVFMACVIAGTLLMIGIRGNFLLGVAVIAGGGFVLLLATYLHDVAQLLIDMAQYHEASLLAQRDTADALQRLARRLAPPEPKAPPEKPEGSAVIQRLRDKAQR